MDLAGYRIAQEALTDVVKHAGTDQARVQIVYGKGEVEIEVTDDGVGQGAAVVTGAAHADPIVPTTWAEIYDPYLNAAGNTLCVDDPSGSTAQFQKLQLWRCHGYASNGSPQRWVFTHVGNDALGGYGGCSTSASASPWRPPGGADGAYWPTAQPPLARPVPSMRRPAARFLKVTVRAALK
jgi:hypothetical protein